MRQGKGRFCEQQQSAYLLRSVSYLKVRNRTCYTLNTVSFKVSSSLRKQSSKFRWIRAHPIRAHPIRAHPIVRREVDSFSISQFHCSNILWVKRVVFALWAAPEYERFTNRQIRTTKVPHSCTWRHIIQQPVWDVCFISGHTGKKSPLLVKSECCRCLVETKSVLIW